MKAKKPVFTIDQAETMAKAITQWLDEPQGKSFIDSLNQTSTLTTLFRNSRNISANFLNTEINL